MALACRNELAFTGIREMPRLQSPSAAQLLRTIAAAGTMPLPGGSKRKVTAWSSPTRSLGFFMCTEHCTLARWEIGLGKGLERGVIVQWGLLQTGLSWYSSSRGQNRVLEHELNDFRVGQAWVVQEDRYIGMGGMSGPQSNQFTTAIGRLTGAGVQLVPWIDEYYAHYGPSTPRGITQQQWEGKTQRVVV